MFKSRKEYSSRLARQEAKRFTTQAVVFSLLALIILGLVIMVGIPALINLAVVMGDLKNTTAPITQTDTIPPAAPQLVPLAEATNSATISITGYAESGSIIHTYVNGSKTKEVVTDEQGVFYIPDLILLDGSNSIYAEAVDQAGNVSNASTKILINVYPDKPELNIFSPENGSRYYGQANQTVSIDGTTDSKNRVSINERQAVVLADGSFKHRLQLNEGENKIQISVVDPAGNETTKEIIVFYQP